MVDVVVLGGTGMLGSMAVKYLSGDPSLKVAATARVASLTEQMRRDLGAAEWRAFDAESAGAAQIRSAISESGWVVNAIGVIKPYIHDDNAAEVARAVRINALFPHLLAGAAEATGARVIQIATDCVYSGQKGRYVESDKHDALDAYGKTKSLGEVGSPGVCHLRCSIIGPERKAHVSLLDWFMGQEQGATVNGYTNHLWNGVTTLHFAKLCQGIIRKGEAMPHMQHVVPSEAVSKANMLQLFALHGGRQDLTVCPGPASLALDRTLATEDEEGNRAVWAAAGYQHPPTVPQMIEELFAWLSSGLEE